MQIHAFAAQHAFVNRVLLVAFNRNIPFLVLIYNHTTSHAAIAAGSGH
jgi:hypothetical protein